MEDNIDADFLGEIFEGAPSYEMPVASPQKRFLPWHKPRKQYVRDRQWRAEIEALLRDSPIGDGALHYLGLPGVDLIDLRYIHRSVCLSRQLPLRFLGFNSGAKPNSAEHEEMIVSLDEVKRLPLVHALSDVKGDDFALIARQNSLAGKAASEHGPYDVVNLDLCDGFGKQSPGKVNDTYYSAITTLLTIQTRRSRPWLLFLTTRTDKPTIADDVLERLVATYLKNLQESSEFLNESRESFGVSCQETLDSACATGGGHLRVFLTGLSKWFISLGLSPKPQIKVAVRSVMGYRVRADADHEDLVSIAFRFTPVMQPIADPAGLATNSPQLLDEPELAIKALRRIKDMKNADSVLSASEELRARMVDEMGELLAAARYSVESYREWVASGEALDDVS